MGIGPQVRTDFFEVPLKAGDCALLCSDGLTNMVEDEAISQIAPQQRFSVGKDRTL